MKILNCLKNHKKVVFLICLFIVFILMGVGFSALEDELSVSGNVKIPKYSNVLYDIVSYSAKSDENLDFSTDTSTGTYVVFDTMDDTYPVYYYRGNVTNNNIKFAKEGEKDICWKIVRTTDTGGVKLIYNGLASEDGSCNNTGKVSQIDGSVFNLYYNSPAYVGYMYGTVYNEIEKLGSEITDGMVFGNDVEYKDGKYNLLDLYTVENGWDKDYSTIGEKYHYTCFSPENSCEKVNYIYYIDGLEKIYYMELQQGLMLNHILDESLSNSSNEISSSIKDSIDNWYQKNLINYTSYLEDTIWCNDRSINQLNGWDKDKNVIGYSDVYLKFGSYGRNDRNLNPSLVCTNENDKFTLSVDAGGTLGYGNNKLTYPVAMLTADELVLAGAKWDSKNSNLYLYNGEDWWTLSPIYIYQSHVRLFLFGYNGNLDYESSNTSKGIRPSISLKVGTTITDGNGSSSDPFVIQY